VRSRHRLFRLAMPCRHRRRFQRPCQARKEQQSQALRPKIHGPPTPLVLGLRFLVFGPMPSRPATVPTVFVNGAPDPALHALEIVRDAGGQVLDTCTYELDLAATGSRLANFFLGSGAGGAVVEVWAVVN